MVKNGATKPLINVIKNIKDGSYLVSTIAYFQSLPPSLIYLSMHDIFPLSLSLSLLREDLIPLLISDKLPHWTRCLRSTLGNLIWPALFLSADFWSRNFHIHFKWTSRQFVIIVTKKTGVKYGWWGKFQVKRQTSCYMRCFLNVNWKHSWFSMFIRAGVLQ